LRSGGTLSFQSINLLTLILGLSSSSAHGGGRSEARIEGLAGIRRRGEFRKLGLRNLLVSSDTLERGSHDFRDGALEVRAGGTVVVVVVVEEAEDEVVSCGAGVMM
jgi:hypothetical protein